MQNRFLGGLCALVLALPLSLAAADSPERLNARGSGASNQDTMLIASADEPSFNVWLPENRKALGAGILMLMAAAIGLTITVTGLKRDLRQRRRRYVYRSRRE